MGFWARFKGLGRFRVWLMGKWLCNVSSRLEHVLLEESTCELRQIEVSIHINQVDKEELYVIVSSFRDIPRWL